MTTWFSTAGNAGIRLRRPESRSRRPARRAPSRKPKSSPKKPKTKPACPRSLRVHGGHDRGRVRVASDGGRGRVGRAGRLRSRAIGFPSARRAIRVHRAESLPATVAALAAVGVPARALFAHQSVGVSAALAGDNVVVATGTASGKSVCYNAPALEAMLHDPNATTMHVFPTKALARDQLRALTAMLDGAARATYDDPAYADAVCVPDVGVYDGDTPEEERRRVRCRRRRRDFHQSGYASRVRASQPPRMGRHAPRAQVRRLGRSARVSRRVRVARRARDASLETRVSRRARRRSHVRRAVGDNRRSRRARLGPHRPIRRKTRRGRKGRARGGRWWRRTVRRAARRRF